MISMMSANITYTVKKKKNSVVDRIKAYLQNNLYILLFKTNLQNLKTKR